MYTAFYGCTTSPFALTPDPRFLYRSTNHDKCLRYLLYGLERGHGLIVLTGKMGTGKTLLLNTLVQSFDEKTHRAFLRNAKLESLDLLRYIFHALRLDIPEQSKAELVITLKSFVLAWAKSHEKVVLIIDESQHLSMDVLEELRLLTNVVNAEQTLLPIILVGQPQLASLLEWPELTELRQRIDFRCYLLPLDAEETKGYIEKRLAVAGATSPIFTARAMKKIWVASQGIPRVINLICDAALLFGFGEAKREIGPPIIQQVVKALDLSLPEQPLSLSTLHAPDTTGAQASDIPAPQGTRPPDGSPPSHTPEGVEQVESQQRQRWAGRPHRLALVAGLASVSLLGAGLVFQLALTGSTLREYTTSPMPRPLAVVPPSRNVHEPPLLPQSPSRREPPLLPHSPRVR
jgi:general secretion pathway protein A